MIFEYLLLLLVSYICELGLSLKLVVDFYNDLFDEGYKINGECYNKIADAKYKVKVSIWDLVPGVNIIRLYFKLNKSLKDMRNDPVFINNLDRITEFDKSRLEEAIKKDYKLPFINNIVRGSFIMNLCDTAKVRYDGEDLGTYTSEELKENDGVLSDEVLAKMKAIDNVTKNNEGKEDEQSFYILPGEYNMSDVFRIDANAKFIKTPENLDVAIVGANASEVNEFLKKSLIVKPDFNAIYHIISIKPFDKNLVRRALVEREYFSTPFFDEFIDIEEQVEEKKKTL